MALFLLAIFAYAGFLILYKPAPNSLKADPLTLIENFRSIKASFTVGIVILVIFFITSNFNFNEIDEKLYMLLAINNIENSAGKWPIQMFTHLAIHINIVHILTNVTGIAISSVYERRVGSKRFLALLTIGSLSSIPSIFFYSEPIFISGISGGIYGLAVAYFIDDPKLTLKEWMYSLILFLIITISLYIEVELAAKESLGFKIDHIGHFLGALGAIIYCRLVPISQKQLRQ